MLLMKAVLISGVSGGVGLETAKQFINNGYFVFGLDKREPNEIFDNLTFIKTDITKKDEIEYAFNIVKESGHRLSSIICTAGVYDLNSLVEISEEEFIKIFDINVFSIYRINKAFLPLLEDRSKVIMISSELGPLDPLPFTGIYAITKSLVEKYAYSLRMELQLLGHQVVLIRPGAIDTGMIDVSVSKLERFTKETKHYQYNSKRFLKIANSVENKKIPPYKVARLIYKVSLKKKPRYVYKINRNPLLIFLNVLPHRLQNCIIKKILTAK